MKWVFAALLIGIAASPRARACAGCSNPNLPQGAVAGEALASGRWRFGALMSATALRVVHESHCPEIGPVCQERDEPAQLHDQTINLAELRLTGQYGLSKDWTLDAQLPVKVINTSILYRRPDGSLFTPDYVGIHHRDETLTGVMDPWLSARFSSEVKGWRWGARLGLSIPLGHTVDDPFAAGERGEEHQHFQFGTGTFNPLLGLDGSRASGRFSASGYVFAQPMMYENDQGFRAGHRVSAGTSAQYETPWSFTSLLTLDVVHEEAERWQDVVQQDGNLGRTDLLAGLGLAYQAKHGRLMLALRTPVYQRIVGGQVSYPAIVSLGWQ